MMKRLFSFIVIGVVSYCVASSKNELGRSVRPASLRSGGSLSKIDALSKTVNMDMSTGSFANVTSFDGKYNISAGK